MYMHHYQIHAIKRREGSHMYMHHYQIHAI